MRAYSSQFICGSNSSSRLRGEKNLQTIIFSIFPCKVTPQAGEEAWGHLLVFIQINHSQTGLFEDKVTGERAQKDSYSTYSVFSIRKAT